MIEANFFVTEQGDILGFRLKGHSGYACEGSDIVCAAASSAALMTANTITEIINVSAEVEGEDSNIYLRIFSKDAAACRDILGGFKLHMLGLEEQYPKNIIVNYTEV